jgi:hypothetical protein
MGSTPDTKTEKRKTNTENHWKEGVPTMHSRCHELSSSSEGEAPRTASQRGFCEVGKLFLLFFSIVGFDLSLCF